MTDFIEKNMNNKDKIILDLCGGTGAWSKPYKDAGYDVRLITSPEYDVRRVSFGDSAICFYDEKGKIKLQVLKQQIYGILAAPPCTMFSFARTKAKKPRDLAKGMECVSACLDIIRESMEIKQDTKKKKCSLKFWALENPNGFLKYIIGKPAFEFDPYEFGDGYKKKTHLWGWFNEPQKKITKKLALPKFGSDKPIEFRFNKEVKSITPAGFAKAFYEANK